MSDGSSPADSGQVLGRQPPGSITQNGSRKLDGSLSYLTERLADFPGMGAWVLSWEILAQGYEGGYERVKIACRCLRGDSSVDVVARLRLASASRPKPIGLRPSTTSSTKAGDPR